MIVTTLDDRGLTLTPRGERGYRSMKNIKQWTGWNGALAALDLAASLISLGNLALDQGDLTTAQELHQQALALRETRRRLNLPETVTDTDMFNLKE